MLKSDQHIDNVFEQGLGSLEVKPPEGVWQSIEAKLDIYSKKRRLVLFWRVSAAASIVIAGLIAWFVMDNNVTESRDIVAAGIIDNINEENIEIVDKNENISNYDLDSKANSEVKIHQIGTGSGEPVNTIVEEAESNILIANISDGSTDKDINHLRQFWSVLEGKKDIYLLASSNELNRSLVQAESKKEYYSIYAYEEVKEAKKSMRMLLGGSMSSSYSYRESTGAPVSAANYSESGINTLGGGVNIRLEGKSRWSVETGVLFAQMGQELSNNNLRQADLLYAEAFIKSAVPPSNDYLSNNSMGRVKFDQRTANNGDRALSEAAMSFFEDNSQYNSELSNIDGLRQTLDYVEVPLLARYKILDGFPILSIAGGVSSNFLIGNNAYLLDGGERIDIGETEDIKPLSWSSSVGLGLELPLSRLIRINIEPRMKYYLESVSTNPNYDFQPYSFAVFGGVTFILK